MFCLPENIIEEIKRKFISGELDPVKLANMTSAGRHKTFADVMGESNAKAVNALFESKLLLKNQQQGIINWAKRIVGLKPETLRDIISRVNRMDKILQPKELETFLQDLASQKLGIDITFEEASKIAQLAKEVKDRKGEIKPDSPIGSKERIDYGLSLVLFKEYVGKLKLDAESIPILEGLKTNPIGTIKKLISTFSGTFKSILAAYDNSFFGKQGIKVLYNKPDIWFKNFIKSWGDIKKEMKGLDAMTPIKADIYSRPNAINGLYDRMKVDIGIGTEEAFPSALPEKIPYFKRLYKASESSYNGAALRMRADLADSILKIAEKNGIDLKDKLQAQSIGNYVNSMTGRGNIGRLNVIQNEVNTTFFSLKLLKSNFDTLTAHQFQKDVTSFVRKQAAISTLRIIGTIATAQLIANTLFPGSVDKKHIGKIKMGGVWVDISGGMGSIAQLSYNIAERVMNQTGKYGETTGMDVWWNFWEGKLSPLAGIIRDITKGQRYGGQKPTFLNETKGLIIPLPAQQFLQLQDNGNNLGLMILEGLGFSIGIPFKSDWTVNPGKELQQFLDKVGEDKFKETNDQFNTEYADWLNTTKLKPEYKSLSNDDKTKVNSAKKVELKNKIFRKYDFRYREEKSKKLPKFN